MSIRPMDLQVMIPKTTETSRIQHMEKQAGEIMQSQLAAQFNEQMQVAREKVIDRTREKEIKMDTSDESSKDNKQKNDRNAKKRPNKKDRQVQANHIDIKV